MSTEAAREHGGEACTPTGTDYRRLMDQIEADHRVRTAPNRALARGLYELATRREAGEWESRVLMESYYRLLAWDVPPETTYAMVKAYLDSVDGPEAEAECDRRHAADWEGIKPEGGAA